MWWRFFHLETDTVIASEDSRLDVVRDDCEILYKDMDLANIVAKSAFKKLNRDSMKKNWKFGNFSKGDSPSAGWVTGILFYT